MKALHQAALLLSTFISSQHGVHAWVGDEVCITGYIMDKFCIDLGFLLDDPSTMTLKNPEKHSFHCLLDVPQCKDSGYLVLTDDKDEATAMHCLGARLEDTDAVIAAGLPAGQKGYCTDCTGDASKPERGYRATIIGTIKDMGDGTDGVTGTPILENIQVLDESVGCAWDAKTVEPVCMALPPTLAPSPDPTDAPTSAIPPPTLAPEPESLPTTQTCPDTLGESTEIDSSSTLHYAIVPSNPPGSGNGLLCGRLEVDDHDGWIGFGISEDQKMAGSQAIIGVPGEDVLKYDLGFYVVAGPMSEDKQTLTYTECSQEDGKTIMKFTKLLVEDGEIPISEEETNIFLYASGGATLAHHSKRVIFEMAFKSSAPRFDLEVGSEVCITNYIMDQFCINLGHFLDDDSTMTLEHPEEHSFHCLLDVPRCKDSGYVVLTDKDEETGMHCLGYRLEDTDAVIAAGLAAGQKGYCTDCTGDASAPERGFRATVKGTVKELGDGTDGVTGTPVLENIQVLPDTEECAVTIVNPVCMAPPEPAPLEAGDEVCITNYIMDQFCINLGHFLDDDSIMTLEQPEEHSFHCLLDVPRCKDSGYVVLGDKDEDTGMHCLGFRLEDTDAVVQAGLAAGQKGYCTDCTGDSSKPERGYRATVKGTVKTLGDGTDGLTGTPILENIEVLDESVVCKTTTVPPLCMGAAPTPVIPPAIDPGVPAKDCTSQQCEEQLSPDYLLRYQIEVPSDTTSEECNGCTISMELIYDGEAWTALAFSNDGQMIGSEAVIGNPGDGTVLKYNLVNKDTGTQQMPESQQTLSNTSVEVKDGQTITKFTKIMKESGEIEITTGDNTFLWAYGLGTTLGYHADRKSFELNLSSGASEAVSVPNKSAWLAHGILAFMAWGVLVPFAVQSSLLRSLLPSGPIWFKLHRAFNSTAYALFIVIFAIAVAYTGKEGGTHFNNGHQKMGLAMFILATFQVVGGALRPHVPAPDSEEEKTQVRKMWEVGHHVFGAALLACGFWQMSKGIELFAIKYSVSEDNENALTIAYWVWTGVMAAIIVLGGGFFKSRSSGSDTNNATPLADADPDAEEGEAP